MNEHKFCLLNFGNFPHLNAVNKQRFSNKKYFIARYYMIVIQTIITASDKQTIQKRKHIFITHYLKLICKSVFEEYKTEKN